MSASPASSPSSSTSSTPPVKRRRSQSRPRTPPLPTPASNDEEDNSCPICLDVWTNAGAHHVCCMPCGHLFGYSCIKKWLSETGSKSSPGACPTCKTPARVRDLRYLFGLPGTLRVADVSESDALRRELDAERAAHALTRAKLRDARRANRSLSDALADAQRTRAVTMGSEAAPLDEVRLLGTRKTGGASIALAFDAGGALLFPERMGPAGAHRLMRASVSRLANATPSPHAFRKRVNALAVCRAQGHPGFVAVADAGKTVTLLTPALQLATEFTVSAVPLSVAWLSNAHQIGVGLLSGRVAVFDIRNASGAPLHEPLVADNGWRSVHSLGEVTVAGERLLIAGAPCGVFGMSTDDAPLVRQIHVGDGPIAGVSAHDGVLAIAAKPQQQKPTLSIYNGLVESDGSLKAGRRLGEPLQGYAHDAPFIQPGVLPGETDHRGAIAVCPDTGGANGVQAWAFRRDGMEGERWVRLELSGDAGVGVRAVGCVKVPAAARVAGLPSMVRGIFAGVADDSVRLFSAGRHR